MNHRNGGATAAREVSSVGCLSEARYYNGGNPASSSAESLLLVLCGEAGHAADCRQDKEPDPISARCSCRVTLSYAPVPTYLTPSSGVLPPQSSSQAEKSDDNGMRLLVPLSNPVLPQPPSIPSPPHANLSLKLSRVLSTSPILVAPYLSKLYTLPKVLQLKYRDNLINQHLVSPVVSRVYRRRTRNLHSGKGISKFPTSHQIPM